MKPNKQIPTNREIAEEFNKLESEFQIRSKNNIMMGVCKVCKCLFKMKHFMEDLCPECVEMAQVF